MKPSLVYSYISFLTSYPYLNEPFYSGVAIPHEVTNPLPLVVSLTATFVLHPKHLFDLYGDCVHQKTE